MKVIPGTILGFAVLAAGLSLARANPITLDLSAAQGFNLLTSGNASLVDSDTEGRVAVGGNATFNSYSIGDEAGIVKPSTAALVVAGSLTAGNGNVFEGSIDVGGSYSGPGYNLDSTPGSTLSVNLGSGGLPFNIPAAYSILKANSLLYGSQAANGTSVLQWSTLTLTGANSTLDIFDISAALLQSASTVTINAPSSAQVLINVSGTSVTINSMGFNGSFNSDANTLFNFYQATTLTMSGVGIDGSVLAPLATVDFVSGQLNGELIAGSYLGEGELHVDTFNSKAPVVRVPDSGSTAWLLGSVLVAGACWNAVRSRRALQQ